MSDVLKLKADAREWIKQALREGADKEGECIARARAAGLEEAEVEAIRASFAEAWEAIEVGALPPREPQADIVDLARKARLAAEAKASLEQRVHEEGPVAEADPAVPKARDNLLRPMKVVTAGVSPIKLKGPAPEPMLKPKGPAKPFNEKPAWPPAPEPPAGASALERLTYPRGLLGHLVQYVEDTSSLPNRLLSLAVALSACAKGLDRKVLGPRECSMVLWVLILAETGAGKQHGLNCIRMILRAMGAERALAASGLNSVQGIEEILEGTKTIEGNSSPLIIIDEVGGWLSRISSKGQTGNVAEIPAILQSLEMKPVHGPAFAIFGISTEKKFIKALTKEQVENGFVNRKLIFNIGRGAEEMSDPKYSWQAIPKWLGEALKAVAGPAAPEEGPMRLVLPTGELVRDFRRVDWSVEVKDLWWAFDKSIRGMPNAEDRELWIRTPEYALRLGTLVAVFRGSAVVDKEDWEWAKGVVEHSMRQLVSALRKNMSEDLEAADLVDRIREEFLKKTRKAKPGEEVTLTQGVIHKFCERLTKDHRKIGQALDHLVKCGDIVELDQAGKVGQPTRKWRWQG